MTSSSTWSPELTRLELPFPHAERRTLAIAPIELIIGQVRFPTVAALFSNDGFVNYANSIAEDFPNASPQHQLELTLSPGGLKEQSGMPVWKFEDLDAQWTLTLSPGFLALETRKYQSFSEFLAKLDNCWKKLLDCHSISHRTRLGLRYVDKIGPEKYDNLPSDWLEHIPAEAFPLHSKMSKVPQKSELEHRFLIKADLALTFRSRLVANGFNDSPQTEFVLDLDAFDPSQAPATSIKEHMQVLKEATHNAFWWTLGPLFDLLDPQHKNPSS